MKNILAEIITIGDEILYGQILDTNSQWMSYQLDQSGIRTIRKSSVGDQEEEILTLLAEAEQRADIILITGGLGPTNDDITKKTLAKFFKSELKLNTAALKDVTLYFKSRGRELTDLNKLQAFLPEDCTYIQNKCGTAPGMWFEKNSTVFISVPGVPFEMKAMMEENILPALREKYHTPVIYHKIIKTIGIGESYLADKILDWEKNLPSHIKLAYLPSLTEVKLRLTSTGENIEAIKHEVEEQVQSLHSIISEYIFGYDDDTLPQVIGKMLFERNLNIATAESCTGGYVGHLITSVPGSSDYYRGSVIAYHNDIKQDLLEVTKDTLKKHGAVSEETVKEMAEGVRKKLQTDIGVSSSGIAGPGGGTEEKPVGTVWIAYSDKEKTVARKLMLGNDRDINIQFASIAVLNLIRQSLLKKS